MDHSAAAQARYFALVDPFADLPLGEPKGVFRLIETATTLSPERFDRRLKHWVFTPDLIRYRSGGEVGAEPIAEDDARRLVEGWGGTLEAPVAHDAGSPAR